MKITNGAAGVSVLPKLIGWQVIFVGSGDLHDHHPELSAGLRQGRACISVREDEIAAEAMGINTTKYKITGLCLGRDDRQCGRCAVCLERSMSSNRRCSPSTSRLISWCIVVFGGMGSFTGSFIAAGVIGVLNTVLQQFSDIRMILYGLMLVGIMIFRPSGLLGTKEFTVLRVCLSGSENERRRRKDDGA